MAESKARTVLNEGDQKIIDAAYATRNPSIFTDYYFRNTRGGYMAYPGSVRHALYYESWKLSGKPASFASRSSEVAFEVVPQFGDFSEYLGPRKPGVPLPESANMAFFEKRGFLFLPWALNFDRARQEQLTVIGLTGTGKTKNIGLLAMYHCATTPNFRFLNVAPMIYQSNLMVRSIMETMQGSLFEGRFLLEGKKGFKEKPYAMFKFANGSTAEFMNVEKNAANIQGWFGDWINVDEAGLLNETDESGQTALGNILIGLATRLRGERPDGKPRMGRLSMVSMAYDCDTLWELYDMGTAAENAVQYYSALVLHKENQYLTPKDIDRIIRNVPVGQEGQWLRGERPAKKGAEFSVQMIEAFFSDQQWQDALVDGTTVVDYTKPGVTYYCEEIESDHVYLMAGDPGMGEPPYRNAPVVMVWDVTGFPNDRARLVMMWWGYGNGSLNPFLAAFGSHAAKFHVPNNFRGYDSTSTQRHIAELAWASGDDQVIPLSFDGAKKWEYINAAKLLMSKGLLMAPSGLKGLEKQLRDYRLPDKKLSQDLVTTLCMSAFLMFPLYRDSYPEELPNEQVEALSRFMAETFSRDYRPYEDRGATRNY